MPFPSPEAPDRQRPDPGRRHLETSPPPLLSGLPGDHPGPAEPPARHSGKSDPHAHAGPVRLPADKPIDELPGVQTALMCQDAPGDDLRLWVNMMRPTGLANMHITLGCEPGKTLEQSFLESAARRELRRQRQLRLGRAFPAGPGLHAALRDALPAGRRSRRDYARRSGRRPPEIRGQQRPEVRRSGAPPRQAGLECGPADRSHAPLPPAAPCAGLDRHGRAVPRIVMRKGSLVHREVLARVPTGFEGGQDDGAADMRGNP